MTTPNYEPEIQSTLNYLSSPQAIAALNTDSYWPKWNSPWWHMLLLHEMGQTKRIPQPIIEAHVAALNRMPIKVFAIHPGDIPEGVDPASAGPCHCSAANVYQVLSAWGLDVDSELPWLRPVLINYQMPDGGMNCDESAYLVKDEVPSSMVGTIASFEAVLLHTKRPWTPEEKTFLDKAAQFLIDRQLRLGSPTKHNASERESALKWTKLCFPRFYLYDVLRGLRALLAWRERTGGVIPPESIRDVMEGLHARFPDGIVRNERLSYEGVGTILPGEVPRKRHEASLFPLLDRVSRIGEVSPFLTAQWRECN